MLIKTSGFTSLLRLLIVSTTLFLSSCFTYEEIEFVETNYSRISQLNKEKTIITLNVRLKNPNNYKIKVVKSDLELFVGGASAGKAIIADKIILKKHSEEDYDIIVEVSPKELTRAILTSGLSILLSKSAQVKVKGWIKGRVFVFGKKFPVELKHNIDISKLKLN